MSRVAANLAAKVRRAAKNRCGYCLLPQAITASLLEVEHLLPLAQGGTDDEENLWLACRDCNGHKSDKVYIFDYVTEQTLKLFNPRAQSWRQHFKFSADKTKIIGVTACGRATVIALRLNNEQAVNARGLWVAAGWYPPED
jgi:hypothetical protein